jgi:transposase
MKDLPDLKQLTDEAKDALIVVLWEELQKLRQKEAQKDFQEFEPAPRQRLQN